jgi:hypothetical protein
MKYPPRDPRLVEAVFYVWLSKEMIFNNPGKGVKRYPKNTKAEKVKYNKKILRYLDRMEEKVDSVIRADGVSIEDLGRAVAIKMDGLVRYVWRSDLMTEREFDEKRTAQKKKLGMLRKKPRRTVDKV